MATETMQHIWQGEELDACTRRHVVRDRGGALSLRRGITLTDESGRCNTRDTECIEGLRLVRKTLMLDGPLRAQAARISVYLRCDAEDGQLSMSVNGHDKTISWQEKRQYWEDAWHAVDVDPAWLQAGANDIVLRALDGSRWTTLIEESRLPDRSAVSDDGGQTWRTSEMGTNDRADGEYLVRLWLDQHAAGGEITSTVVDLLHVNGNGVAREGQVQRVKLDGDCDAPAGTTVTWQWRAGSTPAYAPSTWSAWVPVSDGVVPDAGARFFQWQALMSTQDAAVSPTLRQVSLQADVEVAEKPGVAVTEADNRPLMYNSFRFSHLPADDERGRILRERWKLDQVVGPAKTEFEAMVRLSQWVREQWEDGWNRGELQFCPPWDALLILELAGQKLSLGMCTHYATVFTQCCAALGFTARTMVIRAHCVSEVWSNDFGKWVTMDTGGDSNDETKYTYHFERDGVPMSAREAHDAWVKQQLQGVTMNPPAPAAATGHTVEKRIQLWERIMMNPRNDEPSTLGPGEPENGQGAYHFDGYLFWEDEGTTPLPWYSRHSDRIGDFEWDVDRVRLHLQSGTAGLRVDLESVCANLDRFEVRLDGGAWEAREASFELALTAGEHRIEARTVNAFGRAGLTSSVTVQV